MKTQTRNLDSRMAPGSASAARCGIIVTTHRARNADYDDRTTPLVAQWLKVQDYQVASRTLIDSTPEKISAAVERALENSNLLVVCGGTGIGPDDRTPQTLQSLAEYEIPGFGEVIRREGAVFSSKAPLGRGGAFVIRRSLVLAISASPNAALEQLTSIKNLIPAALCALQGHCRDRH
jgi:molybdenum cofactor synthesis domain-containing protein